MTVLAVALALTLWAGDSFLWAEMGVEPRLPTVCIDPGHGGVNSGAKGPGGLLEKDVALKIARKLKFLFEERMGGRVVLTREADADVALDERTSIANHNDADIFVSIHLNASRGGNASGSETFFLNYQATDSDARAAATNENGVLPEEALKGGDGSQDLQMILWELAQAEYLEESSRLAESIQAELNGLFETENRGIKQAPFRVLMGARMPAVLVEVGFISNKEDEKRLSTDGFQASVAQSIYRGINGFLQKYVRQRSPGSVSGGVDSGRRAD
ncbi:MAG: N-acetylmuramoyl-L-alanine amidase [Acidobacteria bacterium]|nr:N-acetylmuramoyl-L-alanine amidase [Acidobacteriota bacterium]